MKKTSLVPILSLMTPMVALSQVNSTQTTLTNTPDSTISIKHSNTNATPSTPFTQKVKDNILSNFTISAYGNLQYQYLKRDDYNEYRKSTSDLEKLSIYLNYRLNHWMTIKSEIEFEHGGTGSSMEFDPLEEAGEFEVEVEQGGEVKLERLYLDMLLKENLHLRVGRIKIGIGGAQTLDRPTQYFTVNLPEMENALIPIGWHENGIQFLGKFFNKKLSVEATLSNGLDASGFSSRNWIKRGYQTRFEKVITVSPAFSTAINYHYGKHKDSFVGLGYYINNTTPNRPKKDMEKTSGYAQIIEGHASLNENGWRLNSTLLWGYLQHSNIISIRNKNLPNKLHAKRTPVAQQALGASLELGYNVFHFLPKTKQELYPFARIDWYDSMFKQIGIKNDYRWRRTVFTAGINWFVNKNVVFKLEAQDKMYGSRRFDRATASYLSGHPHVLSINAAMGFSF